MNDKSFIFILSILILIFTMGAFSANTQQDTADVLNLTDETNESLLYGCCSVVCQLEGNNSIISFRRDANYSADIKIEKIDWHGKPAIKQYKEDGGYFCQVIVTSDGWVIGFGGLDDGEDSKKIENLTAEMVVNNSISNSTLQQIQEIKDAYGRGHVVIKAPNGTYGVALSTTYFTGVLKPGDYISVPNKYSYFRSGDIQMNASDKIRIMNTLEISDAYGLARRDVTTYYFHTVDNDTYKGNITDIYIANDDGSFYGMNTGGLFDDVFFNGTKFNGSDIPIAPNYTSLGNINFTESDLGGNDFFGGIFNTIMHIIAFILLIVVVALVIRLINQIRYSRRRR